MGRGEYEPFELFHLYWFWLGLCAVVCRCVCCHCLYSPEDESQVNYSYIHDGIFMSLINTKVSYFLHTWWLFYEPD